VAKSSRAPGVKSAPEFTFGAGAPSPLAVDRAGVSAAAAGAPEDGAAEGAGVSAVFLSISCSSLAFAFCLARSRKPPCAWAVVAERATATRAAAIVVAREMKRMEVAAGSGRVGTAPRRQP
jgi:hypothetical protein